MATDKLKCLEIAVSDLLAQRIIDGGTGTTFERVVTPCGNGAHIRMPYARLGEVVTMTLHTPPDVDARATGCPYYLARACDKSSAQSHTCITGIDLRHCGEYRYRKTHTTEVK